MEKGQKIKIDNVSNESIDFKLARLLNRLMEDISPCFMFEWSDEHAREVLEELERDYIKIIKQQP